MLRRLFSAPLVSAALLTLAACGGGDSSTPTPAGDVTATPDVNLPPAGAVVIFGSPEATNLAIEQALESGAPATFFLGSGSRDDASFDGLNLGGVPEIFGTALIHPAAEEFDAVYEAAYGEAPGPAARTLRSAYDSVYFAALAAVAANSSNGEDIQAHLHYVANSPGEVAGPGSEAFAAARDVLVEGGDVNYAGASGQVDFTSAGEPSKGQLEVWRLFGGMILGREFRDVDLAAETGSEVPSGEFSPAAEPPLEPLRIGAVLPLSGDDSNLGPSVQNALQLAVDEINASGGVFGLDVQLLIEDDAGDASQAVAAAETLAEADVGVIVGSPGRIAAQAVIDNFEGVNEVPVLLLSDAPALRVSKVDGVFRATTSSLLEVPVLANLALEAEIEVVCVLHEESADDLGLAEAFRAAFEHKEGAVRALVGIAENVNLEACLGT